jgi:transcription elongation factor GreA
MLVLWDKFGGFVLTPLYFESLITMTTLPITKRGAEILKAELHKLKTVERPSVIAAISEARAQGDLSENAEYDAAKDRQGFIEGRIIEVEGKLSVAQVIDPKELNAGGKIVFGTTVDLESEDTGAKVTYQIVGRSRYQIRFGQYQQPHRPRLDRQRRRRYRRSASAGRRKALRNRQCSVYLRLLV